MSSNRDRSTTCLDLRSKGRARKREYLGSIKKTEKQLIALQRDVDEESRRQQELAEKNLILAELITVQERTKAIYEKHKRWLAAGGPTADELKLQQQLEVALQVGGTHWCLYALETATWEQLQAALSYDCGQWIDYLNSYFQKLVFLSELLTRTPEQQAQLLQAAGISPAPRLPLVYNFKGLSDTLTPAWGALLEAMQTEGCLVFLALLHGNLAMFDAASRHAGTRQQCAAPPTYWARLAQRMRFTRLQKLHFKLALENYQRQARAAAAQGLSLLQETPSYAFLLACEAIAAQQQQQQEGTEVLPEAAAGQAAAAAAAEAVGAAAGGQNHNHSSSRRGSQGQARGSPDAGAAGARAPIMPSPPSATAGDAGPAAAAVGAAGAAAAAGGGGADQDMVPAPGAELQRQMAVYFRQLVALNLFLTDTLSLEQGLIMNKGAYPFWPLLPSIAEAAIQLPDNDQPGGTLPAWQDPNEVVPDSIELLLSQRRHAMTEAHDSLIPSLMKLQL